MPCPCQGTEQKNLTPWKQTRALSHAIVVQSHTAVVPARILTKVSISLFNYYMSMHDHCLTNVKMPFLLSVTCHVGVPSCGQRHRNVFIVLWLTSLISNITLKSCPRLASMRLVSGPFSFAHPPTPVYLSPYILHPLKPNPVEEDWWKGFIRPVHRPSPRGAVDIKSPASTHPRWLPGLG